jgi:uncharacterized OsmC-like protein
MTEFLVELYFSKTDSGAVTAGAELLDRAAAELAAEGRPVRIVRSIFVPEDETWYVLVEARTAEDVHESTRRAALRPERVAEATLDLTDGKEHLLLNATTARTAIRNGVDTQQLYGTLDAIKADPTIALFQFRARNRWLEGAHNRTTIRDFYAANQEDTSRGSEFVLDAGEPAILLGSDTGPNPAEHLLHALAACLTTSLVYVAAARGVELTEVESTLEGDMDVRGALGLSDEHRNGFERIRVSFRVAGNAPEEKLREIVARAQQRSAVFDMVTNGVAVTVEAATA